MASTIFEAPLAQVPTARQFIIGVRKWMKKNKVGARQFARLTKTSTGTLSKLTHKPDTITMATITKYQKVMRSYKSTASSRSKGNPGSRVSRRGSP